MYEPDWWLGRDFTFTPAPGVSDMLAGPLVVTVVGLDAGTATVEFWRQRQKVPLPLLAAAHSLGLLRDRDDRADGDPQVVCAWCKAVLKAGTVPPSHGICAVCLEAVMRREGLL